MLPDEIARLQSSTLERIGNAATPEELEAVRVGVLGRKGSLAAAELARRLDAEWVDLTLPARGVRKGSTHPISQIQQEIEDVFTSMGFAIVDGPEVETEWNNFDALNIPPDHPARDMQDTFWLEGDHVLRTHTSPVQIRGMQKL